MKDVEDVLDDHPSPGLPDGGLGSARRDVQDAAGLPNVPMWPKRYIFHYFGARPGISLLSQRSLIRSPSEARLCVFPKEIKVVGAISYYFALRLKIMNA